MIHQCPALILAAMVSVLLSTTLPVSAHEGEDHGATAKPADVRLAPRFEVQGDAVEVVGVLADKNLVIYLDRIDSNAPIEDAQVEIEGTGIKGIATAMRDGVYQLSAGALNQPGNHPLTITVQAGEISDLLSANLEIDAAVKAAAPTTQLSRHWWLVAGAALLLGLGGLIAVRLRRQSRLENA